MDALCVTCHHLTFVYLCDWACIFLGCVCLRSPALSFACAIYICLCAFLFVCVCSCLSTRPVCFVSLQSADKDTLPAQLFSTCLSPWWLQLHTSTSLYSPVLLSPHLTPPPLSPSPSLHCYPTPIISLLFAHDTSLLLHPHGTFLHSLVLLISKLKTSHCQVGSDCHMLC